MMNSGGLTTQDCNDVSELMNKKYGAQRGQRYFKTTAHTLRDSVEVRVVLQNSDQSFFYPVESRMKNVEQGVSAREAELFLLDYVFLYFDEYFRDDDTFLPIDWSDFSKEGYDFQMRGQILNLHLERLADDILEGRGIDATQLNKYRSINVIPKGEFEK